MHKIKEIARTTYISIKWDVSIVIHCGDDEEGGSHCGRVIHAGGVQLLGEDRGVQIADYEDGHGGRGGLGIDG